MGIIREKKKFTSLNRNTNYNLCFLRHGQSTWNRDNVFIGWSDTPLTEDGVLEARVAGQMLSRSRIQFDEVHTSLLRRSIRTVNLVLMEMEQEYLQVHKSWRLNERSYDTPPPPHDCNHPHWPGHDRRYQHMLEKIPGSESLKDTRKRSSVYWDQVLAPSLKEGKTLLIVGHENNLRSLIMNLEDISPHDIINLNLPRGIPLAYRLNAELKPLGRPDGKLDEATGMLQGVWLGGDQSVKQVLDRDDKQVYDVSIQENLEVVSG